MSRRSESEEIKREGKDYIPHSPRKDQIRNDILKLSKNEHKS